MNTLGITTTVPSRRFPPPWSVEDIGAAFVVTDGTDQKLAYGEARRIAEGGEDAGRSW